MPNFINQNGFFIIVAIYTVATNVVNALGIKRVKKDMQKVVDCQAEEYRVNLGHLQQKHEAFRRECNLAMFTKIRAITESKLTDQQVREAVENLLLDLFKETQSYRQ